MKILANDGISPSGIKKLEAAGFEVVTETVPQEQLIDEINNKNYVALLVRSATTVRKDLIDACPGLKFIGRGGVGMDNIDVDYARSKGITVENTPASSSQSVAELVLGSMLNISRFLNDSYRNMPVNGKSDFKVLKKKYGKGIELRGKTLLIVGFGRIGQSLASYALGVGMKVIAVDHSQFKTDIPLEIHGVGVINAEITTVTDLENVIGEADFISLHVPKQNDGSAVLSSEVLKKTKKGVRIVNAARGGVCDEDALIEMLENGHIAYAALDVYENEPSPRTDLLENDKIACTPHIGAATVEAQARIGEELADKIIATLK